MNVYRICSIIWCLVAISMSSCKETAQEELPVYSASDFNSDLVDKSLQNTKENHRVLDFHLINQNGEKITQRDYENKIYVVDFFFTRCPSICPIMTANLVKVQEQFIDNEEVMLLSISVTPSIDTISVLRDYATTKRIIDRKWNVTTGDKKHIYELARKSYFAVVEKGDGGLQDFIHTPNLTLVDKEKRIRGIYDGTDDEEVLRLISDMLILRNSYE